MTPSATFTNRLGEVLAPFLLWMRDVGFFEWYVYIPVMTASAVGLFLIVVRATERNGTFNDRPRRAIWLAAYFGLCFLATNGLAVGLKTLIVEELDYTGRVWFEAYVGPLHFYITAVAAAYLWLIARNRRETLDHALGVFVQAGLLAGYAVGVHRLLNEPFSLSDPTTGISGLVFFAWFGVYNLDLYRRLLAAQPGAGSGPRLEPRAATG